MPVPILELVALASVASIPQPAPVAEQAGPAVRIANEPTLPSGWSAVFREQMTGWEKAASAPSLRVKERSDVPMRVHLDRLNISSPFGIRSDPFNGAVRHHYGIDLPARRGSPVMATGPGTVRIAGWVRGYGKLIEIEHPGGVRTRFGHLSRIEVFPSEHVTQGEEIGKIGSTGRATGPHLHYEVRVNGIPINPLTFSGNRAVENEVVWGPDLPAVAKRAGWEAGQSLPRAAIR